MKTIRKHISVMLVAAMILSAGAANAYGNTYPDDVPSSHWAYGAVDRITSLGLMTGKTVSTFDVNGMLDKNDTTKILAALAGYKTAGATQEELNYFEYCYNKHAETIYEYSINYANWNHDTDTQIAYLLELGIYTPPDLENFYVLQDGAERRIALSRFEVCVFFARLLGDDDVARSFVPDRLFSDDADIPGAQKPYVYYMRYIGVISGDTEGNFNPTSPVTKVAMSVMLYRIVDLIGFGQTGSVANTTKNSDKVATLSGQITQIYDSFRAIEVKNRDDGTKQIYPVLNNASIAIDNESSFFNMLEPGMEMVGVLVNGELQELIAISGKQNVSNPQEQYTSNYNQNYDSAFMSSSAIEGIVSNVRMLNGNPYLDVQVKLVNSKGEIYEETRTFLIANNCEIIRGDGWVDHTNIMNGDLAKLNISGTTANSIYLEEKHRNIVGVLVGKRAVESTGQAVLSVQDSQGRIHELVTTDASILTRKGFSGIPSWMDIRLGDSVEISAEYDKIMSLGASGTTTFVDTLLTGINIRLNSVEITAMDEYGKEKVYLVITSSDVDPYALRVGSKVRLGLDSQEVENILVLENPVYGEMTGYIRSIGGNTIIVQSTSGNMEYSTLTYDSNTIVNDSVSGNRVSLSTLRQGMRVSMSYDPSSYNYLTSVTIIAY